MTRMRTNCFIAKPSTSTSTWTRQACNYCKSNHRCAKMCSRLKEQQKREEDEKKKHFSIDMICRIHFARAHCVVVAMSWSARQNRLTTAAGTLEQLPFLIAVKDFAHVNQLKHRKKSTRDVSSSTSVWLAIDKWIRLSHDFDSLQCFFIRMQSDG